MLAPGECPDIKGKEGLKGESQEKSVSFVQGGYAFNRSLLSYSITHQMPGSLWKKELLKTPVSECLQDSSWLSTHLELCVLCSQGLCCGWMSLLWLCLPLGKGTFMCHKKCGDRALPSHHLPYSF